MLDEIYAGKRAPDLTIVRIEELERCMMELSQKFDTNIGNVCNEVDNCVSGDVARTRNLMGTGMDTDVSGLDRSKSAAATGMTRLGVQPSNDKSSTIRDALAKSLRSGTEHGQNHHNCDGHSGAPFHRGDLATRVARLEDSELAMGERMNRVEEDVAKMTEKVDDLESRFMD